MRISDLISLGSRYLVLGLLLAAVLVAIFYVIFRFILKKKDIKKSKLLWWALFICYLVVVIGATLMERGSFWENTKIMPLFYSYKDAWISGLAVDWRNIILNICMFMPLGFLLPLGIKFFESFWLTSLAGFLFTVVIEWAQLHYHLGMFELDDLMNNTVGTMIGYGFYVIYANVILKRQHEFKMIIISQIPLLITVLAFGSLFVKYQMQELGNVPYQCIIPFDKERLTVSSDITFSNDTKEVPVYQCMTISKKDSEDFARAYFENLGETVDESRNDFYDETAVFHSTGRYSLWIDYEGGDYRLTDFDASFSDKNSVKLDATEEEIREALLRYGVIIPNDITMELIPRTDTYTFEYDCYQMDDVILDGHLNVVYNESGDFANIDYSVITCEAYKDFEIISEQEAFEQICEGQFNYRGSESLELKISGCSLGYVIDSKGFYQPVYEFHCKMNGQDGMILTSAVKK